MRTAKGFFIHNYVICEKCQFYIFSNLYAFILFFHLIISAKTSSIMINTGSESSYPFILWSWENTSSSSLNRRLALGFLIAYCQIEEIPFISSLLRGFSGCFLVCFATKVYWILLFLHLLNLFTRVFSFIFLIWITWISSVKPTIYSWNKLHWIRFNSIF